MNVTEIIDQARHYVSEELRARLAPHCTYHNVGHTMAVYDAAIRLARDSHLDSTAAEHLGLAALFHDIGYIDGADDHEARSSVKAGDWLTANNYDENGIKIIQELILSTKVDSTPTTIEQQILRDADMQHLAQDNYVQRSLALKTEMEAEGKTGPLSLKQWLKKNLVFFANHQYQSPAGIEAYREGKKHNYRVLKKELKGLSNKKRKAKRSQIAQNKAASMQFKTALRNHIDLSAIADNKANMMLSVNALILTISIPAIGVQLADRPRLLIPFALLLVTCILSIIFATLATKPIKMTGLTSLTDIESGKGNLFFFGNFFQMPRKDYERGINLILKDEQRLESAIVMDLYHLGRALGGKYRYLRICYNLFMYGLIATTVSFLVIMASYIWS